MIKNEKNNFTVLILFSTIALSKLFVFYIFIKVTKGLNTKKYAQS